MEIIKNDNQACPSDLDLIKAELIDKGTLDLHKTFKRFNTGFRRKEKLADYFSFHCHCVVMSTSQNEVFSRLVQQSLVRPTTNPTVIQRLGNLRN